MSRKKKRICVWLPSPMGDAVMSTPALRAIREHFAEEHIIFACNSTVREFLSPSSFNDEWIDIGNQRIPSIVKKLRGKQLDSIVLLKNSFGSAFASAIAQIPERIGYSRDGRGFLLTEKVKCARDKNGNFKPLPMVEYYLKLAKIMGCKRKGKHTELKVDKSVIPELAGKLPAAFSAGVPLVIIVPGGAFGPSKLWPVERFAKTADMLSEKYNATVVVSVAPDPKEGDIARQICQAANNRIYSLNEIPLTIRELKVLFGESDLVITNDTGPRHVAIALNRKVITLFGPNNPEWTETDYYDEIKLIGKSFCSPCDSPKCSQKEHYCMEAITVKHVMESAKQLLTGNWEAAQR